MRVRHLLVPCTLHVSRGETTFLSACHQTDSCLSVILSVCLFVSDKCVYLSVCPSFESKSSSQISLYGCLLVCVSSLWRLSVCLSGRPASSATSTTLRVKPTASGCRFCVRNIPETQRFVCGRTFTEWIQRKIQCFEPFLRTFLQVFLHPLPLPNRSLLTRCAAAR